MLENGVASCHELLCSSHCLVDLFMVLRCGMTKWADWMPAARNWEICVSFWTALWQRDMLRQNGSLRRTDFFLAGTVNFVEEWHLWATLINWSICWTGDGSKLWALACAGLKEMLGHAVKGRSWQYGSRLTKELSLFVWTLIVFYVKLMNLLMLFYPDLRDFRELSIKSRWSQACVMTSSATWRPCCRQWVIFWSDMYKQRGTNPNCDDHDNHTW